MCISFSFSDSENYKEQVYEKPIYGLNLKNDEKGSFILGTGSINNKLKYYYYKLYIVLIKVSYIIRIIFG